MDSVLTSIKKMLGITEEYTHFDLDIIMHINSVFSTLTQLGVGPPEGYFIEDDWASWDEFLPENKNLLGFVKSYMLLKVRLLFDPPLSSAVIESMNRQISELEWRITVAAESEKLDSKVGENIYE